MDTSFAFWFIGAIALMVLTFVMMAFDKINDKYLHKDWEEKIEFVEGLACVTSTWCTMMCMLWLFA